jgi:hypothetical protein
VRFNPAAILAALERHDVRYVLIGGLAANAHGVRRTTRDVDVIVERSRDNLGRLADAARELEVGSPVIDSRLREIDPLDVDDLANAANVSLDTREGELDVMTRRRELRASSGWPAGPSRWRSSARACAWQVWTTSSRSSGRQGATSTCATSPTSPIDDGSRRRGDS